MIPDENTISKLWDTYHLPEEKRLHSQRVGDIAMIFAKKLREKGTPVGEQLLYASAMLHDIDKNIEKLPGENHPDAGVRVLKQEGMDEVGEVIRTHPLHTLLDEKKRPKTIEQQIVYIADKMTKYECIGIDRRFAIWKKEDYDEASQDILARSYPLVKSLQKSLLIRIGLSEEDVIQLSQGIHKKQ